MATNYNYRLCIDKLKLCYKISEDVFNSIAANKFQNKTEYQLYNVVEDENKNGEIINIKTAVSIQDENGYLLLGYLTLGHNRKI